MPVADEPNMRTMGSKTGAVLELFIETDKEGASTQSAYATRTLIKPDEESILWMPTEGRCTRGVRF